MWAGLGRRGRARRRSAPRLSSPAPDSGVHIYKERGERITTIRMTAEIFPKCATRRKWVLGYVQEGKVLKVVLSIKFIWGRDILYPRPSKIDWASLHWKSIKGRGEERDWNNDHTSKNIKKTFLSYDNRILIPRGAKKITDIGCPGILMILCLCGEPGCIHNIINDTISPDCSP